MTVRFVRHYDTGALDCRDGIWHWRTTGRTSARLAEHVAVRLAAVDPSTRHPTRRHRHHEESQHLTEVCWPVFQTTPSP